MCFYYPSPFFAFPHLARLPRLWVPCKKALIVRSALIPSEGKAVVTMISLLESVTVTVPREVRNPSTPSRQSKVSIATDCQERWISGRTHESCKTDGHGWWVERVFFSCWRESIIIKLIRINSGQQPRPGAVRRCTTLEPREGYFA